MLKQKQIKKNYSRYKLCDDSDETINHIMSECSKRAQKDYKRRHDSVGTKMQLKLRKNLKCDNTAKWYMHKPESVQENGTNKTLLDFEKQTDHLITM